jgi:hypothetical protein
MQITTLRLEQMTARRRVALATTKRPTVSDRWRDRREVVRMARGLYGKRSAL